MDFANLCGISPLAEERLSVIATDVFNEILKSSSDGMADTRTKMQDMLNERWVDITFATRNWSNEARQDHLYCMLWNLAVAYLAPVDCDEEHISAWAAENKAIDVMRLAFWNSSPKVCAIFWTQQAAKVLWNLRMKFDVVSSFSLMAEELEALIRVDPGFTELFEDQRQLASILAESAFNEVMDSDRGVEQVLELRLTDARVYIESSHRLFWESMEEAATQHLLSHYLGESLMNTNALVRARTVQEIAHTMLHHPQG
ncbi:MAG: hypothetical protein JWR25_459 [Noviherbaspirillum sp.]|nr:hypothetical protein [Noviherbaspirillum sp.]